jgi:hypothetical protein
MRKPGMNVKKLKDLRPATLLTGGFTLITAGCWNIFGVGVGLIAGGILTCVLQWVLDSD